MIEKQEQIDAVKMVRQIRDAQYEIVKNKTEAERIAYYQEKAERFMAKWAKVIQEQQKAQEQAKIAV
jgi:hypothetical protein